MEIYKSPQTQPKIDKIIAEGKQNLHIISDFDGTITMDYDEYGNKLPSGVALLRDSGLISEQYSAKAKALFAKYYPFEISLELSLEEKKAKMYEWWTTHLQLLVESGVTKEIIDTIVKSQPKMFRKNTDVFFAELHNLEIPLLIFSAGKGDIIDSLMNLNNFVYPNIHTISNYFKYDQDGKAIGYNADQIIHTFNKNETSIANHPYSKKIISRKNVILLGNSMGDTTMADGIETDTLLKIGFLDQPNKDGNHLPSFLDSYDVVITNGGDFSYINEIISRF